jgi:hypothetical protein
VGSYGRTEHEVCIQVFEKVDMAYGPRLESGTEVVRKRKAEAGVGPAG